MKPLEKRLVALYKKKQNLVQPIDKQIKAIEKQLGPTNKFLGGYFESK